MRKMRRLPGSDSKKGDGEGSAPADLATARQTVFAAARIDTTAYTTIRDLAALDRWVAAARETGVVAFDTETTSLDPMQAELVGFSLAIADNGKDASGADIRAAYVP